MVDAEFGGCVLQFDGRVLEFFGAMNATSAWRRHVRIITAVIVTGPDKHGNWSVAFQPPQKLLTELMLNEAEYAAVQPILDALRAADVAVSINP